MTILYIIITILITLVISYFIFYNLPKGKIYKINTAKIAEENQIIDDLKKQQSELEKLKGIYENDVAQLNCQSNDLHSQIFQETQRLEEARIKNNNLIDSMFQDNLSSLQEKLDLASEKASKEYQQSEEEYRIEYSKMMEDLTQEYLKQIEQNKYLLSKAEAKYEDLANNLEKMARQVDAAVEANKRDEERRTQSDFYRVVIPDADLSEIAKLREVEPYLRDKEALNKVIWKVYYEKPTNEMIGRVVGATEKTGIYKITEIASGKCYVGQAVKYWPMKNFSQLSLGVY